MILKAKHNAIIYPFFKWYIRVKIRRNFQAVKIKGEIADRNLPVLLITNHNSWWDGLWVEWVNQQVFKRKFYFMMLEEQLRNFWFFNYTGGYSVRKNSKSIIESLAYTRELLIDRQNLVLMYPQGKIQSMHDIDFQFKKGIEHVLKRMNNPVQLIFMVSLIDYFSNPKPGLFLYLKEYTENDLSTKTIRLNFSEFYQNCIELQKQEAK
ncbi:MAG: lysophospholipid acyltransferase family protein [Draconibacterium sp.]